MFSDTYWTDICSCFGMWTSCPKFVTTFQLHSVYKDGYIHTVVKNEASHTKHHTPRSLFPIKYNIAQESRSLRLSAHIVSYRIWLDSPKHKIFFRKPDVCDPFLMKLTLISICDLYYEVLSNAGYKPWCRMIVLRVNNELGSICKGEVVENEDINSVFP
jgi:hypothetical protein